MYSQQYSLEPANYSDYRDFLKQRFLHLKKTKGLSLQTCAQRSKISKSLLQFLLNKKRHASLDKIPDLAKVLKFTGDEEYFVYLMVCKNSSRNAAIKEHFERILNRIRNQYLISEIESVPKATEEEGAIYKDKNALLSMLQAFVRVSGFKEDPEWIAEKFMLKDLTASKVAETLKTLEDIKAVLRDAEGRLVPAPKTVYRPDPYDPNGQQIYRYAAESMAELLRNPELFRPSVYMSMSLAMDGENLSKAEKYMFDVHNHLNSLAAQSKEPVCVVQVANFLLNVAHVKNHVQRK